MINSKKKLSLAISADEPTLINATISAIEELNKNDRYNFLFKKEKAGSLLIVHAKEAEDFYSLGMQSAINLITIKTQKT